MILDSENRTKAQRVKRWLVIVLMNILVLVAASGVIYGHVKAYVSQKEQEVKMQQIQQLQGEVERLKAQS